MSLLSRFVDERFLAHRRRSTSIAGMSCAAMAMGLFAYRFYVLHVWSWDPLVLGASFVAIKLAVMIWSYATE
jgi:hypothetical protein